MVLCCKIRQSANTNNIISFKDSGLLEADVAGHICIRVVGFWGFFLGFFEVTLIVKI